MQNPDGAFAGRTAAGWQSVVLPYTGNLQAVAMLPPASQSSSAGCATPSAATLATLTAGPAQRVGVVLPKLNLSQTLPLTQTLAAMGLPLAGNYSGLGPADGTISTVVQKVVMKVDEKGTKAAAATGIGIATSIRVGEPDHHLQPARSSCCSRTRATHTPLFLARVANPTQS